MEAGTVNRDGKRSSLTREQHVGTDMDFSLGYEEKAKVYIFGVPLGMAERWERAT